MTNMVEYIVTNRIPKVTKADVKKYPVIACIFPAVYSTFCNRVVEKGKIYFWDTQPLIRGTTMLFEKQREFGFDTDLPTPKELMIRLKKNNVNKTHVEYKTTTESLDKMQDKINTLIKKQEEFFYEYSDTFVIVFYNPKTEETLVRHYAFRSQMPKHTAKILLGREEYKKSILRLTRNIFNTILWRRLC